MAQTRNFTGNVNDTNVVGIVVVPECDRREPLKRLHFESILSFSGLKTRRFLKSP
ncbi:hypothetical protein AB7310_11375 [Cylindrospermopsis raciborskii UAM/DH-BiRr]|jgi:hypothetical protein|uniref:hypothetical protein n=1 Tax=Cylindrospermopsis raciborskii TaxID=77022 RepID=UPI001F3274D1|nr:hypothetical protein [Cylindrospermopsis raciborskii]UJS03776.1 hypothetical protein L3I90_11690 [Cylindrospermopsis raciborskii KLL07]